MSEEQSRLAELTGEIIGAKFRAELIRETMALLTEEDKRRFATALLARADEQMDAYRAQDYAREAVKDEIARLVKERHGERLTALVDGIVEAKLEEFTKEVMSCYARAVTARLRDLGQQIESFVRSNFRVTKDGY